jgi:hypothetical protein
MHYGLLDPSQQRQPSEVAHGSNIAIEQLDTALVDQTSWRGSDKSTFSFCA